MTLKKLLNVLGCNYEHSHLNVPVTLVDKENRPIEKISFAKIELTDSSDAQLQELYWAVCETPLTEEPDNPLKNIRVEVNDDAMLIDFKDRQYVINFLSVSK